MAEGEDDKPRPVGTLPPPSRAEHAARKLGFRGPPSSDRNPGLRPNATRPSLRPGNETNPALGSGNATNPALGSGNATNPALGSGNVTGNNALKPQQTQASANPKPVPATPAPSQSDAAKDAVYAARRSLVAGEAPEPPKSKPIEKRPARSPMKSPIVLIGGGLLLVGALVFGTMTALRLRYEGSDEGRVRGRLTDVEFAPHDTGLRDSAWGEIDSMSNGPATAVSLLLDTRIAERGSSRSTHKMQELANQYLIHFAATKKADPPPKALEMAKLIFEGQNPPPDQWSALQQTWRTWLDTKK